MLKKIQPNKYVAFKYAQGSNQYVTRVKKGDNPSLRAGLCALAFFSVFSYLGTLEVERAYHAVARMTVQTFNVVAEAPTHIISPLATAYASSSATIKPTHEEYIKTKSHGDIILRIYSNESSEGKNPFLYCTKKGMQNDFGYGVTLKTPICFKTFEDSVNTVNDWFDKELKTHTLAESLELYSGNSQTYISNFLNK